MLRGHEENPNGTRGQEACQGQSAPRCLMPQQICGPETHTRGRDQRRRERGIGAFRFEAGELRGRGPAGACCFCFCSLRAADAERRTSPASKGTCLRSCSRAVVIGQPFAPGSCTLSDCFSRRREDSRPHCARLSAPTHPLPVSACQSWSKLFMWICHV